MEPQTELGLKCVSELIGIGLNFEESYRINRWTYRLQACIQASSISIRYDMCVYRATSLVASLGVSLKHIFVIFAVLKSCVCRLQYVHYTWHVKHC